MTYIIKCIRKYCRYYMNFLPRKIHTDFSDLYNNLKVQIVRVHMRILFSVGCNIILLKIYIYILGTIFQARSSSMMKKIIMKTKFTLTMKWLNKNRFLYQSSVSILSNSMCRSKSSSAFEFFWKEIDRSTSILNKWQ